MNPPLMISAIPATISLWGKVSSVTRSTSTAAGSWKEPTRFLPASVLIPVLPPTAASTMASSVVGTWITRTPRIQVAATKPARSVAAPPPREITASLRVSPMRPRTSQQKPATAKSLPSSASGISTRCASTPTSANAARMASAVAMSDGWWMMAAVAVPRSSSVSSLSRPRPTITS